MLGKGENSATRGIQENFVNVRNFRECHIFLLSEDKDLKEVLAERNTAFPNFADDSGYTKYLLCEKLNRIIL